MLIGNRQFDISSGHTYIMGILNVTPDSFSDGGRFLDKDQSLRHAEEMIKAGADIIDIGGESTRPGYQKISETEEIERVCRTIELIKGSFDIPISVDTYKEAVMEECLKAGADLANDIWGLRFRLFEEDETSDSFSEHSSARVSGMAEIISRYKVPVVMMHNDNMGRDYSVRESLLERYSQIYGISLEQAGQESLEENVVSRVIRGLQDSVRIALEAGITEDKLILDPGVGFAKTYKENLRTIKEMGTIKDHFKLPLLLGTSRKSVIGEALDLPVSQREEGTLVTTILAAECGCCFVRVHDVEKNKRAIRMFEAVNNS